MKTQAQRLPVDVKVTDLEKLRDTRAQKRADDESFSYNPQRLCAAIGMRFPSKLAQNLNGCNPGNAWYDARRSLESIAAEEKKPE